jgi:hypothetical protein
VESGAEETWSPELNWNSTRACEQFGSEGTCCWVLAPPRGEAAGSGVSVAVFLRGRRAPSTGVGMEGRCKWQSSLGRRRLSRPGLRGLLSKYLDK